MMYPIIVANPTNGNIKATSSITTTITIIIKSIVGSWKFGSLRFKVKEYKLTIAYKAVFNGSRFFLLPSTLFVVYLVIFGVLFLLYIELHYLL